VITFNGHAILLVPVVPLTTERKEEIVCQAVVGLLLWVRDPPGPHRYRHVALKPMLVPIVALFAGLRRFQMFTTKQMLAAFALCAGISTAAIAQDSAFDFGRLRDQIRTGDTVYVTDSNGRETRTSIRDAGGAEVERLIDELGRRAPTVTRVQVERSDSLWNGTFFGLAIAGTPWLIVCALNDWSYYNEYGAENLLRTTALTTAAIGAGVGTLWDLSVKRKVILYPFPR
jgi:hypothetical protein